MVPRPYMSLTEQHGPQAMHLPAQAQPKASLIVLSLQPIVSRKDLAQGLAWPPKPGTSHHPCNSGPGPQGGTPSSSLKPPDCSWGTEAAEVGWTWEGCRAGLSPWLAFLIPLMSLPADELEQVLQDGQRCVRARHSLAEGLSWGPFRGSIQSRASSPTGQAEPVRSPDHG